MALTEQGINALRKIPGLNMGGIGGLAPNRLNTIPNNFSEYFGRIAKVESAGKYDAVNSFSGAMGKYQFMPDTLKSLGFNVSKQDFLMNPQLQEQAMLKFTQQNIAIANKKGFGINAADGFDARETKVLSTMHYGGAGALKNLGNYNFMNKMQAGGHMSFNNYNNAVARGLN